MPIEIRELVIRTSIARQEDKEKGTSVEVLTNQDINLIRDKVIEGLKESGDSISPKTKQDIIEACIEQMKEIMAAEMHR